MEEMVITIARGFGSGGKTIGKMLSKQLQVPYYDYELIRLASEKSGINVDLFGSADERPPKNGLFKKGKKYETGAIIQPGEDGFVSQQNLFNYQAEVIREAAEKGSCVFVGRCADYVLKDRKNVIRVFIHANMDFCVKNVLERFDVNEQEAVEKIRKIDKVRSSYYKTYTGHEWDNARNYDLCLNSSDLGFEKCVELIIKSMEIFAR